MKLQNEKDHFAENLPSNIGTPIWNKLKVQKFKNFNARSSDTGTSEIVYIPLSNDNEYLSGVLVAEKQADSAFSFEPLPDEYLYNLCHQENLDIEKAEKLLGVFLYMDSYTFEKTEYKNIPVSLFANALGYDVADGKKKIKIKAIDTDNRLAPIEDWGEICWIVATSGSCSCAAGSANCSDWQDGCADCSDTYCFRWMLGSGGSGSGGTGGGGTGGTGGDGGTGGGGGGGGNTPPCGGSWYRPQPCNGTGTNNNQVDANGFYFTKIDTLKASIALNPFSIMPCDSLNVMPLLQYGSMYQQVAQYKVPQNILDRLDSIKTAQGIGWWVGDDYNIQSMDDAFGGFLGGVVNCDFFPVKISQLPNKPGTTTKMTSAEFLEYFRLHINDFISDSIGITFSSQGAGSNFNDSARWYQPYSQAMGALQHIHIPGPGGTSNDGSVVLSDYKNLNSTIEHNYFKFSTLETYFDYEHPVAGNREFGLYNSSSNPGEFTFYTMGVDRIWDIGSYLANSIFGGFKRADKLWNNVQDNLKIFINQSGGQASFYTPKASKARPDYDAVKDYLKGRISRDSLSIKLGCI